MCYGVPEIEMNDACFHAESGTELLDVMPR